MLLLYNKVYLYALFIYLLIYLYIKTVKFQLFLWPERSNHSICIFLPSILREKIWLNRLYRAQWQKFKILNSILIGSFAMEIWIFLSMVETLCYYFQILYIYYSSLFKYIYLLFLFIVYIIFYIFYWIPIDIIDFSVVWKVVLVFKIKDKRCLSC